MDKGPLNKAANPHTVGAILLAAGRSRRFGSDKRQFLWSPQQSLPPIESESPQQSPPQARCESAQAIDSPQPIESTSPSPIADPLPMLQQSLSVLLAADIATTLVLRADDQAQLARLLGPFENHPRLSICYAADADLGMGHSLAAAMAVVDEKLAAVMVLLADMPWLQAATIASVMAQAQPGRITVPRYQGHNGHPVLFSRHWFSALKALRCDAGARALLQQNPAAIDYLELDDAGLIRDLDRPPEQA